jgi:hypothetical protein
MSVDDACFFNELIVFFRLCVIKYREIHTLDLCKK